MKKETVFRHFHRKSLCDARLEFSQMDSREKIIEAGLLTAIGTLGITCGFSGIACADKSTVKLFSRGVDAGGIEFVEKNFQSLLRQYFPALRTSAYPLHAELCIGDADHALPVQLKDTGIRVWIGWRMGKDIQGLMGLGSKIISDAYVDDEPDFLLNLIDNMMFAILSAATRRMVQELKGDLDKAVARSANLALGMEVAEKSLERARFRLSGFNDIFNELSGLKESTRVVDSFLLVLLGIFGAGGGYVFYLDTAMDKSHMACRNLDVADGTGSSPERIQAGVAGAFASTRALQLEPMQAAILSPQQMDCFKPFLPETVMGLIFRVDDTAMGVIGLGERLVQTPYGEKARELFLGFVKNFLVFLKNSKSFETIQRLNEEQRQKNIELEKTIKALSDSSLAIAALEKAGERIKAAVAKTMARSRQVSVLDLSLILITGIVLGLVYNFASPGGIDVIPKTWLHPSIVHVDVDQALELFETRQALIVDARPAEFFSRRHISGAKNLPPSLFDFIYMMQFSQVEPGRPIVVYGRNISRRYDEETASRLVERGHEKVVVFPGGIGAWEKKGLGLEP